MADKNEKKVMAQKTANFVAETTADGNFIITREQIGRAHV